MKTFISLIFFLVISGNIFPQIDYKDILIENSVYSEAPMSIQRTKPFIRERWFFEQRAYPNSVIPADAYTNSLIQREELRQQNSGDMPNINWVSLGPTPGYY
ncbi:MAG: hypothetical protein OQK65_01250, partial [Chlorobium sp.]|nr:hypothetical protein [Chlorobium sp.]